MIGGYLYSVKIEVNTACNLRCPMCYVDRTGVSLPEELIRRLLDQIRGCGVRVEILGGEPLFRKDLADLVAYAKTKARAPFVQIYTNGTLATPERASELKTAGLDAALVTLVSHRQEVHDGFVGRPGAWEATVRGIRNLKGAGIETYTFTPVHALNCGDCRAVHAFATGELGVHSLFYQYVPQRPGDPLMVDNETWHQIKHWTLREVSPEHAAFVRDFFMLTGNACSGGNFVLTVKADGSVQPCPFIDDLPLGNIQDQDIWTIHKNRFASASLREFKTTPAECHGCTYESVCAGGCRAGHRRVFGSYAVRDCRCRGPFGAAFDRQAVSDSVPTFF